jgi:MFS transporter, BCD family, chlorophyll transporter
LRARPAAPAFADSWRAQTAQRPARLRLLAIGLGTLAFGMQDVLLEPYGGIVLGMGVGTTTWLGAGWALGGLLGFAWASRVLARGFDAGRMALYGACLGVPAFAGVIAAAPAQSVAMLAAATLLMGFATGLFSHGTLTLTMNQAAPGQAGLALGTWGAVQATAAGIALGAGGALRDGFAALASTGILGTSASSTAAGYAAVYSVEILLLCGTVVVLRSLVGHSLATQAEPRLGPSG